MTDDSRRHVPRMHVPTDKTPKPPTVDRNAVVEAALRRHEARRRELAGWTTKAVASATP